MTVLRSILLFALAALAEIGGAWLVWQGVREHRGLAFAGAGILALGLYGFVATFQPDPHFGRILAAYGGVFVAASLAWGMANKSVVRRLVAAVFNGGRLEVIDELYAPELAGAARRWIVQVWSLEDTLDRLRQLGLTDLPG